MIEGTLSSEFGDLVAYEFFKNLALSALGIFIPIILFDASGSLIVPGVYLLIKGLVTSISAVPIMNYLSGKGFEKGLYLSYFFLLPPILLLQFVEYSHSLMVSVAILYSLGKTLHAESKKLEFTEDTEKGERDKRSADITSIPNMGRFLGPMIAGSLSALYGFSALLTFAIAMILLSLIPLSKLDKSIKKTSIKTKDLYKKEYRPYIPLLTARGIQAIAAVSIYGLFTYEFLSGSFGSGFVRSLDTLGFVIVAYLSAWITDKASRKTVIGVGASAAAITYVARALVQTPLQGFLVAFAGGIAFKLYHIPLFSQLADEAQSTSETEFFALGRICTGLGMAIATTLFIFMLQNGARLAFQSVFILAAVATMTLPLMERKIK